jgi:MOSC domain-containing protein YiiM
LRKRELDFDTDVLPLLLLEMRIAFVEAAIRNSDGYPKAEQFRQSLAQAPTLPDVESLLLEREAGHGAFDTTMYFGWLGQATAPPQARLTSAPEVRQEFPDSDCYAASFREWLQNDLAEANQGLDLSPTKVALELCRELRDIVRYAVDFNGLTPASEEEFHRRHRHLFDRAVVGPQRDRTGDLLALIASGIVAVPLGPDPRIRQMKDSLSLSSTHLQQAFNVEAHTLIKGYLSPTPGGAAETELCHEMLAEQFFYRHQRGSQPPRGIEIDGANHPVSRTGVEIDCWVFGLLCEGATYYNNYIPSPGHSVRCFADTDRAVNVILDEIRATMVAPTGDVSTTGTDGRPHVIAVAASHARGLGKTTRDRIRLIASVGVEGDIHSGLTAQHLARKVKDSTQPNLRQVHLIPEELFRDLGDVGIAVRPGDMGENITTRGIDLLALPRGTHLVFPSGATIEVTGLRNPCRLLDRIDERLYPAVRVANSDGTLERRAGVMGIVVVGGTVSRDDSIIVLPPLLSNGRLEPV